MKLGELETARGNDRRAEAAFRSALEVLNRRHDLRWRAASKMFYGELLRNPARADEARAQLMMARDLFRGAGDTHMVQRCDGNLHRR